MVSQSLNNCPTTEGYPNGQTVTYDWGTNIQDRRLKEILNRASSTVELSRFNYDYRPSGEITAWTQQADGGAAQRYDFDYDEASQLTGATLTAVSSGTVLKRHLYQYDKAGNRVSEQIDAAVQQASHNNVNQLVTRSAGGPTRVQGSLNEAGTVTVAVNGGAAAPATMLTGKDFVAHPTLNAGTNTVALTAKDRSNNTATKEWQVTIPTGATITLSYDDNGNLLDDGAGRTFEWDAANRLLAINTGSTLRTEFTYDPMGRRVKIVEKDGGTVVSTKQHLWAEGYQPVEERDATHAVTKRFYAHGMQVGTDKYFYTRDHLGSIRELTDETKVIRARYDYDPFGRRTKVQGDLEADFGFTGHYAHAASGLSLTLFRAYDANLGRWLSRDPLRNAELSQGPNLYAYVRNSPTGYIDPDGRWLHIAIGAGLGALAGGIVGASTGDGFWRGVISGAIGGAVGAATFNYAAGLGASGLAAGLISGAASGLSSGLIAETWDAAECDDEFSGEDLLYSTLGGMAAGGIAGSITGASPLSGFETVADKVISGLVGANAEIYGSQIFPALPSYHDMLFGP